MFTYDVANDVDSNTLTIVTQTGGAFLVRRNGIIGLRTTTFQSNENGDVVNLGGWVQCQLEAPKTRCPDICTSCDGPVVKDDDDDDMIRATNTTSLRSGSQSQTTLVALWALVTFLATVAVGIFGVRIWMIRRRRNEQQSVFTRTTEIAQSEQLSEPMIELVPDERQLPISFSALRCSPAPIFILDHNMRIVTWSPGMAKAAAIPNPVNMRLSDLPFVHARSAKRCEAVIRRALSTTAEHDVVTIMLHLRGQFGNEVLMEMTGNFVGTGSERCAVLAGCEVCARRAISTSYRH